MSSEWDAIVVGGGPAGVSAAITLCQEGLRPLIIEKERFPRYHIGESMLPKGMELLGELGLLRAIEAEGFLVKPGARFVSRDSGLDVTLSFADAPDGARRPTAVQVERERFDAILLEGAARAGAEVWAPAKVTAIESDAREVRVEVERDREAVTLRAPLLFDASGQSSITSRLRGYRRRIPTLLTHAFFGYFRGLARRPGPEGGNILISFLPGGWIWSIPLRDDVTSVGVVLLDGAERPDGDLERVLLETLKRYLPEDETDYRARLIPPVRAYSAINFCSTRYVDDRVLLVGDAAAFLDPVFSTGVFLGMWGGRLAAKTAARALRAGDVSREALRPYEREARRAHRMILELVELFYRGRFIRFLDSLVDGRDAAKRDIVGLLAGDFFNEQNSLAATLRKRAAEDVPLA